MVTIGPEPYTGRMKPLPKRVLYLAIAVNIPGVLFTVLTPLIISAGNNQVEDLNGLQVTILQIIVLTMICWPFSLIGSLELAYRYRIYSHPLKKILIFLPLLPLVVFTVYYLATLNP